MSEPYEVITSPEFKICKSKVYNYIFRYVDGTFVRWGVTEEDDPQHAPFPEILDIEVTTICAGVPDSLGVTTPCAFCYKGNTRDGINMSLETFDAILNKFDDGLTQIAFGVDATALSNPAIFTMMQHARDKNIVPNVTVANITDDTADKLAQLCGAVAVSRYANKDICYNTVKKLTDRGLEQVNIHMLLCEETVAIVKETLTDMLFDERLSALNAIVFLSLKQTGRGESYTRLSDEKFNSLMKYCLKTGVQFGLDSCSATKFLALIHGTEYEKLESFVEPCEATLFSSYINVDGKFFPCSFAEHLPGIDVAMHDTFETVWNASQTKEFGRRLLNNERKCIMYDV